MKEGCPKDGEHFFKRYGFLGVRIRAFVSSFCTVQKNLFQVKSRSTENIPTIRNLEYFIGWKIEIAE